MKKKMKKWKMLTAAVCLAVGMTTGLTGTMSTAQAGIGVMMDMRATQVIPYKVLNFTPYRLELITENMNNLGSVRLAMGAPASIAPYGQEGSSASIYALFISYEGNRVWHPAYRTRAPGGNYINIEFATDVRGEKVPAIRMDALPFVIASVKLIGSVGSAIVEPGPGMVDVLLNLKDAYDAGNAIVQTTYTDVAGLGYIYGTSPGNSSNLITKNDCVAVQIGDGSQGEQLVIETAAVRQKPEEEWRGYSGIVSGRVDASIIRGGKQTALINIYTQAQYLTTKSIALAQELHSGKSWRDRLEEELARPDAAPYGIEASAASFLTGNSAQAGDSSFMSKGGDSGDSSFMSKGGDFGDSSFMAMGGDFAGAGSEDRVQKIGELNPACKAMVKTLTEAILKKENDRFVWIMQQMEKLSSGKRIDIYDALYWAQQKSKKNKGEDDIPLLPSALRGQGEDGEVAMSLGDISDAELEQKLKQALNNLGIAELSGHQADEQESLGDNNFNDGFGSGF